MTMIQTLAAELWVERLGWTLLHFLWQGLAIAILYAAARRVFARTATPQLRYILGCTALAAMLAAPLVTWIVTGPVTPSPDAVYRIQDSIPTPATDAAVAHPGAFSFMSSGEPPAQFLPWVVIVWLAGAVGFWVRLAGGWVVASRMRSMLVRRAPAEWQDSLAALGSRIGVTRPVKLLVSALVQVPVVVGWLRPVVLVPVGALGGLPAQHVEALLLHELAHVRRHDYLINLLQGIAEALLFYHPAVWWVSSHIRAEREMCCDDIAVSASGDAVTFARALAQLEAYRPAHLAAATLGANGGSLSNRIARLLGVSLPAGPSALGPGVVAVAALLLVAVYGLFAQTDDHPRFQVASIKPNPSNWADPTQHPMGAGVRPGGRIVAQNMSLMLLIQFAYANHDSPHWLPMPASQIVGGPSWIDQPGYDIEAKPEGKTDARHAWMMMQTLLADRFQLKLHRESRELPVYDLVAAKGGPKLPPARDGECITFAPGESPHPVPGKVDCGYVSGPGAEGGSQLLTIRGRKVHVADLVRELSSVMGRPVVDKTGFGGEFDLKLSFTPTEALMGLPGSGSHGDPGGARLATDADLPSIFAALEEQLGLKLVSTKGPVDVLVVDRAERPSAN